MTMVGVPDATAMGSHWKVYVAVGIALVVLGLIALGNLVATTLITTVIVGLLLMVAGVVQVFGAFSGGSSVGWRVLGLLLGILYVLVGWDILADPLSGALTLTLAVSIFLFASGIVRVVTAFTASGGGHRVLLLVTGVINVLLGVWLWTGIPISGLAIGLFVGIDLIMAGVTWMVLAFSARRLPASGVAAA